MTKKRQWLTPALFCLAAAAALLAVASMCSFLYPLNPWVDVNCFMTVGKGILKGKLPYRDLMEQKGPLLYVLHALAIAIAPGKYWGVYAMEALLLAGVMMTLWKTLRLYVPRIPVAAMVPAAAVMVVCRAFQAGDSAEELCLLPTAMAIFHGLRACREGRSPSGRELWINGALAGCILWVKFNLLGFHLGWMAFFAIDALVRERDVRKSLKMCARFLAGMALTSLPWLIWFGAEGALGDLFGVYFYGNIFGYAFGEDARNTSMVRELLKAARQNPMLTAWLTVGGASVLATKRMNGREKLLLIVGAALMVPAIYGGGGSNQYYYMAFAVFAPFAWLALAPVWDRVRFGHTAQAIASAGVLAACVGAALMLCPAADYIGWKAEDTAQGQVAAYVAQREDATLLNVGFLDGGFYYAADAQPASRWFCQLNYGWRECGEAHAEILGSGGTDFAVFAREPDESLDLSAYECVLEARSDYGKGCVSTAKCFYLYEKKVTE